MNRTDPKPEDLERLIAERTAQLELINKQLLQEIAERKHIEEALRVQNAFIDQVVQTSPNLIFVKDKHGIFHLVNQSMADSYGMSREDLIQKSNAEVHKHPDEVQAYSKADQDVIEHGITLTLVEPFTAHTGEVRWYQTIKTPFIQPDGAVYVLGISTDITDLKNAKETAEQKKRLEHLVAELEAKNDELERFTYTVSHDLKSPIVTILGFLGLLEQDLVRQNQDAIKNDMAMIRQGAERMNLLLNELLELSRIGRQVNPPVSLSMLDLVNESIALFSSQIAEAGIDVIVAPEMPLVYGDKIRLYEVIQNLIDNAIKFRGLEPHPRLEIGASQEGSEVICYFRDNGIGIPADYQDRVFGLFERLSKNIEGTGIGLALVKRIVEVHGGRIWIESDGQHQGTTFFFTLPTPAA